ncbi:MAG: hypothetical protein GY696_15590 [Gammaproteobacteria bacterium]|nr:hypothetical protein [Gammaproteobacteria bacterium]
MESNKCFGCGSTSHSSKDSKCPALEKACHNCGITGHFQKV